MAYVQHTFEPNEVLTSGSMNNLVEGINERLTKREYNLSQQKTYDLLIDETIEEPVMHKTWQLADNYYLTTEEPLDWTISYTSYFTKNEIDEYIPVPEAIEGADIPEWEEDTYYGSMSNYKNVILSIVLPASSSDCPLCTVEFTCFGESGGNFHVARFFTQDDEGLTNPSMWCKCENDHGFLRVEGVDWQDFVTPTTYKSPPLKTSGTLAFAGVTSWIQLVDADALGSLLMQEFPAGTRFIIRGLKA